VMRLWKDFRTNLMYWRFRHITRNRLRLRQWRNRRRSSPRLAAAYSPYRGRPMYTPVYGASRQRSWIALGVMVVLLTGLSVGAQQTYINPTFVSLIGTLVVVGCVYWALRGV
jgi:hypothetical protein